MCRQARQAAVEIAGLDIDAIEQRLAVEVERQRYNGDGVRRGQLSWQIRRRVGDDGHGRLAQWCSRRSMIGGSSCLRRSEEHTSELQPPCNFVCRLLLEKKKQLRSYRAIPVLITARRPCSS